MQTPAKELVLDTNGLDIHAAEAASVGGNYRAAGFHIGKPDAILGAPLKVALPPGANRVRIHYETTAAAHGLNWLTAEQTAGRRFPFFYTQSWAILARTWVPLQDSPQVKFTYSANIHTPADMLAVMSAENTPTAERTGEFHFEMRQPIPPHGLALAVGDLAFRPLGTHTGVYGDPAVIERAWHEFEDAERLLEAAQRILGPYRWERYDMLLLPPGALYGGMENPRLTFLAASALAGDKSAMGTVAHELAHSWSGNLVTNATWSDIWISEGITSYLTTRIEEIVYGKHRADVDTWTGWINLNEGLSRLKTEQQILNPVSEGLDPAALLGPIPYQKGALFLRTLEAKDGRTMMDEFLRRYFARFAYESIASTEAVGYMKFAGLHPQAEWLDNAGLPASAATPTADPMLHIASDKADWIRRSAIHTEEWTAPEWVQFVSMLSANELARADREFHFSQSASMPITAIWLRRCIAENYTAGLWRLDEFVAHPSDPRAAIEVYAELVKSPPGKVRAAELFSRHRAAYADAIAEQVRQLLKPQGSTIE